MKKYSYKITYIRYNNTDFKGLEFRNTLAEAIDLVNRLKTIAHLSKFKVQKITEETNKAISSYMASLKIESYSP